MVKGISRQVIVVHSPDQKLFEQAIFILNDEAVAKGVTDDMLLKSAEKLLRSSQKEKNYGLLRYGSVWAGIGAMATALAWLITSFV
jgi:phage portal protein BeeE